MAENDYVASRMFTNRTTAEQGYEALVARGYSAEDVNVVMTEEGRRRHFGDGAPKTELGHKALEGAGVGDGIGVIVAGPIAAALAGAGAGAGGAIGALVGSGIPEKRVKEYERGLKEGGIVIGVKPRTPEDRAYFDREWGGDHSDTVSSPPGSGVGCASSV